jgi:energy-coupling factor transporter ATP-binding protein EcfA2
LTHADRILLMRDGELVADGPPTDVIADQERWIACNLRPTSLLRANAQWRKGSGRLLDSETLARRIVAREQAAS